MKTKTLALVNGIVGLVGGIFLLFAVFLVAGSMVNDAANSVNGNSVTVASTALVTGLTSLLKIALLVLGIIGAVHYKGDDRVGSAPSILLIVGGAIGLVPFLGWVGGILAIIGGALYLGTLKKFKV